MSKLTELLKIKSWKIWLKGLLAAIISGGATGLAGVITIPQVSFKSVFLTAFTAAIAGAALYLKKSPMPDFPDE